MTLVPHPTNLQKDGTPLPADRFSLSGGNLTITGLVEGDRGIYECSATNEAATITAEAELMIENIAPRAPYNLTANSTETCITIRWQPGEKMGVIGCGSGRGHLSGLHAEFEMQYGGLSLKGSEVCIKH